MKKILMFLISIFFTNFIFSSDKSLDLFIKTDVGGYGGIQNSSIANRNATVHDQTEKTTVYGGYSKLTVDASFFHYVADEEIKKFEFICRPRIKLEASYGFLNNENKQKIDLGANLAVLLFETGVNYDLTDKKWTFPLMIKPDMGYYFSDSFGIDISPFIGYTLSPDMFQHSWYNTARITGGIELGIIFNPTRKSRINKIKDNNELRRKVEIEKHRLEEENRIEQERIAELKKIEDEKIQQQQKISEIRKVKEINDLLNKKECYRNDSYAYMLNDEGNLAIICYFGNSKDVLEIPKEINGIPVTVIYSVQSPDSEITFKTVKIPNTIIAIKDGAFYGLGIENVIFEKNSKIDNIGSNAFKNNRLKDIAIPRKEINLGFEVFSENQIKKISIYKDWKFVHEKSVTNIQKLNCIIQSDELEEVVFEDGCVEIPPKAFLNCKNLKKLSLPSSIKRFGNYAFSDCTSLSEITITGRLTPEIFDYGDLFTNIFNAGASGNEKAAFAYASDDGVYFAAMGTFENCPLDIKTKSFLLKSGIPQIAF